ncbi:MAG TPA: TOBE domain-containing protein [Ferruginibacter sp.]|jgi:molybdate transport system regulatory protein|nr:TOBE domain-containing protein [Ferruginibacter sp.]
MNTLTGTITAIQSHDNLSLVKVLSNDASFTSIVLDTPAITDYLTIGNTIRLLFKETEVIIAKNFDIAISVQNRIPCSIHSIVTGVLLSQVNLSFGNVMISSIITTNAVKQLGLQENDTVLALIKTNEVSLSPHD